MKNRRLYDSIVDRTRKMIISATLACMCRTISFGEPVLAAQSGRIHCVTDISHDFSFYFDGRFGKNYVVPNGIDVRNWGTLHKYDFSNVNLLILQSSASPCPYLPEDIAAVREFLTQGGGVVVLGDYALFRKEKQYRLKPLLKQITADKLVDPKRRPRHQMPENKTQRERLPIQYSDYMQSHADAIYAVYDQCFPVIQEVMGVPPSEGMMTNLILLPTGGGGFSSGSSIGLAVWWGNFPEKKYGMVELISHESTHSWVHPFSEPMWNEGIATYVGILVGRKMGLTKDADSTLAGWFQSLGITVDRSKAQIKAE